MLTNQKTPVVFKLDLLEGFLDHLYQKERSEATIRKYAADLKTFYNFLPENKLLESSSLPAWRDHLLSRELAARTVNTRIAACNSFLSYLDRKEWQISPIALEDINDGPGITREEYLTLLRTAKHMNNEWLYFLVKSFCCLGLSVSELCFLTLDALVSGKLTIATKSRVRSLIIPEVLRKELLNFAIRSNINSGSLFKSPAGEVLTRAYIVKEVSDLCKAAGIPEEKGSPKMLREIYFKTYSDIRANSSTLVHNEYSKILEQEDAIIGWENIAV